MREILFRGKAIDDNWYYGVPLIFTEDYVCMTAPHTYNKAVIPKTVGQYTGLTDKNGTKIFEGDIVKTPAWYTVNDLPCVVIFGEEHTVSNVQGFGLYHYINESYELVCSDEWDEFEVIGNIHDNPELLKGGD